MRTNVVLLAGLVIALTACTARRSEKGFFVTKLGNDTVAVESYQVEGNSIQGISVARSPKTTMRYYSMTLNSEGFPESFSVKSGPADGGSQIIRDYRYSDDSIEVVTTQNGTSKTTTEKVSGRPYPYLVNIFGIWDYAIHHALEARGTKEFSALFGNRALKYTVQGTAPGKIELTNPEHDFGPLYATVDSNGALDMFDMTATTDKYLAERVAYLDVYAKAKSYSAREQSGHGVGVLSPRDTVRVAINHAAILIDYGRPEMRGRTIFGNVVPWNEVWRLGANAATQLITNKRLAFGRTIVLPGTYSLFAYPSEKGWKLIINYQHGQWGTVYDASKDLARLPLRTRHLTKPVEQFTFNLEGHGKKGVLRFKWEKTEESIPFTVR
jgi:hypothetical protein